MTTTGVETPVDREAIAICALADALGDHEVLVTPIGPEARTAALLAQATRAPDLMVSDGNGRLVRWSGDGRRAVVESVMPFRSVFDVAWSGRRHVIMGAAQIDRAGNQNIACIGDWRAPSTQLLGMRGAPGNGINHAVTYWIPAHSRRVFVPEVDVVCAPGYDRFPPDDPRGRFIDIRRVVTDLAVLDFENGDARMQVRSLHPGVSLDDVVGATGFPLLVAPDLAVTRTPDATELRLLAELRRGPVW